MFGKKEIKKSIVDLFPVRDSSTGITYASYDDLCKGRRHIDSIYERIGHTDSENAKKYAEAQKQVATLTKKNASLEKRVASYAKDLERMFLQAIGKCETVNQVQAVVKQYHESELGKEDVWLKIKDFGSIGVWTSFYPQFESQTKVGRAAATKIKRLNHQNILDMCDFLDVETSESAYARHMMAVLKDVTGKEVDGTKILEAKKAGLDAMSVFKSVLASYNVKQDEVM